VRLKAFLAGVLAVSVCATAQARPRLKPLIEKLKTAKGQELVSVVDAIGRTGRPEAVGPLLEIYDAHKNSPRLTTALVAAFGALKDEKAVDPLVGTWDYLNSLRLQMQGDFPAHLQILRAGIVEALGDIGGDRVLPVLHDAVQDKDQLVVGRAAAALGKLRDKSAVDALIQLTNRGGNVGQSAVEALAEIGDGLAISPLENLLHSEDPTVRAQAGYALAKLKDKDEDGELVLDNMVSSERLELKDRLFAAYYLARLGSRAGLDFLTERLAKGSDSGRTLAAQALGRSKNPKAVPALAEAALRAKDASLRLMIAQSLGEIGGTRAVYTLRRMEDDTNQSVRAAAKQALAGLGEDL
jgi:HEAT repeat protein